MATDHRKLSAFTLSNTFVVRVYEITRSFPLSERYGLQAQLRRAAVSTATNIVEGCARDSDREHGRYFEMAFASCRESIYLLDLSARLKFIDQRVADDAANFGGRVAAALAALRKSIREASDLKTSRP